MKIKSYELLREWVRAEIDYALASTQEGPDGYLYSHHAERDIANELFEKLKRSTHDPDNFTEASDDIR